MKPPVTAQSLLVDRLRELGFTHAAEHVEWTNLPMDYERLWVSWRSYPQCLQHHPTTIRRPGPWR